MDLPADYKALAEHYGAGTVCGLVIYVPGHPSPYVDLLRQVEVRRDVLRYLIEHGIELPYAPEQLLPWGIDERRQRRLVADGGRLAGRGQRGARRGVAPLRRRGRELPGRRAQRRLESDFLVDRGRRLRARHSAAVEHRAAGVQRAVQERARRRHDPGAHAGAELRLDAPRPPRPSGGRRRSARRRARAARRAPTGAGPRAGPGRRTARRASARTRPAARRPRPRRPRRRRAGARTCTGKWRKQTRTASSRSCSVERRAVRALVVAVDDHQPAAPRARGRQGRPGAAGRSRGRSGQGVEDQVGARAGRPGSRPGGSSAPCRRGRRPRARAAGSRPGGRRRTRGTPRPWARSPRAARSRCRAAP